MTRASPRTGVLVFAMLALVAASYSSVLTGTFVWDDHPLVEQQPIVKQLSPPAAYLTQMFWASKLDPQPRTFYRPLTTFSYALDYRVGHGSPLPFHLVNLFVHLLACALVFALARRLGAEPLPSALFATAFGVAPRLTECIAWISGRTDALALVFSLAALLLFLRAQRTGRSSWAAGLCFLLGLLSKETAITVLAVLVCWEAMSPEPVADLRSRLRRWVPFAVASLGYLLLRLKASSVPRFQPKGSADGLHGVIPRAITALEGLGRYAFMVLDPFQPRVQIGILGAPDGKFVVAGVLVLLLLVGLLFLGVRRGRWVLLGLFAGAASALGLTLHLIPISANVVAADRFLYFPIALGSIAGAFVVSRASRRVARAATVGLLVLIPLCAGVTYAHAALWGDERRLWQTAVAEAHPDDGLPLAELGNIYLNAFRIEDAADLLERAKAINERTLRLRNMWFAGSEIANNAALCEELLGHYPKAIDEFSRAIEQNPEKLRLHYNLAMTYARSGDFDRARSTLERSRSHGIDQAIYQKLEGEFAAAQGALEASRSLTGFDRTVAEARAFDQLGALAEARSRWSAIAHAPEASPGLLRGAAGYLAVKGEYDDARYAIERLRSAGGDPALLEQLNQLLFERFER
jgi:tetratricopeptide (TPR) repeat protein